jgi:hypothetical protein
MGITTDAIERRCEPFSISVAKRLVAASAAQPSDHVIVIGASQIELLLALLHLGFSNVDCLSPANGPHPRKDAADAVIVPAVSSESDLRHILQRFICTLRPRGVFVVRDARSLAADDERRLRKIFFEAGFSAVERVPAHDGSGHLWCAHRRTIAMAEAA